LDNSLPRVPTDEEIRKFGETVVDVKAELDLEEDLRMTIGVLTANWEDYTKLQPIDELKYNYRMAVLQLILVTEEVVTVMYPDSTYIHLMPEDEEQFSKEVLDKFRKELLLYEAW